VNVHSIIYSLSVEKDGRGSCTIDFTIIKMYLIRLALNSILRIQLPDIEYDSYF
jgi:hypothetical protein